MHSSCCQCSCTLLLGCFSWLSYIEFDFHKYNEKSNYPVSTRRCVSRTARLTQAPVGSFNAQSFPNGISTPPCHFEVAADNRVQLCAQLVRQLNKPFVPEHQFDAEISDVLYQFRISLIANDLQHSLSTFIS